MERIIRKYVIRELDKIDIVILIDIIKRYVEKNKGADLVMLARIYILLQLSKRLFTRSFTLTKKTTVSLSIAELEAVTTAIHAYTPQNDYNYALVIRILEQLDRQIKALN